MQQRMMCLDCFHLAQPDTVLRGSDVLELLGWCCFGIPGLLYCWWRHVNRIKLCSNCGSDQLMREARAAAERRVPQAPPSFGPPMRTLSGASRVHWPRALRTPRARLHSGSVGALLLSSLPTLEFAAPDMAPALVSAAWLLFVSWLLLELYRVLRLRSTLPACRAWDQHGRPLHIEQV
jgi:hypothetical protein